MTISTTCSGCRKAIAAPESAAGHKARCPHCGAVVTIPAAAAAVGAAAPAAGAAASAGLPPESALRLMAEAAESPSTATPSRIGGHSSAFHSSATTVDRMLARKSPYATLRVLAVIHFAVGVAIAIVVFMGALAGMIYLSTSGHPLTGILTFAGGLAAALLIVLAAKTVSEVLRLWADVGDRSRQSATLLEDCVNKMKD